MSIDTPPPPPPPPAPRESSSDSVNVPIDLRAIQGIEPVHRGPETAASGAGAPTSPRAAGEGASLTASVSGNGVAVGSVEAPPSTVDAVNVPASGDVPPGDSFDPVNVPIDLRAIQGIEPVHRAPETDQPAADQGAMPLSTVPDTSAGQGPGAMDTLGSGGSSPDTSVVAPIHQPVIDDATAPATPHETASPGEELSNADEGAVPLGGPEAGHLSGEPADTATAAIATDAGHALSGSDAVAGDLAAVDPDGSAVTDLQGQELDVPQAGIPTGGEAQETSHDSSTERARAQIEEQQVTPDLEGIAADTGGTMRGLEHSIKSQESLERKAAQRDGEPTDVLRYTMAFPHDQIADGAKAAMASLEANDYQVKELKNEWLNPVPGDYRGINTTVESPTGYRFELQFHTPESFAVKEFGTHDLYEVDRDKDLPDEDRDEAKLAARLYSWTLLIPPPGIEHIAPFNRP